MPSNRRNIRKRQFDAGKSLKLYRDYEGLYQYLHGDNGSANELKTFEQFEKIENLDKIASMFLKRKNNVPIPDITPGMKENSSNKSEESSKTNFTKVEDKPPVDFYFKPLGPVGQNYIKYTPKVTPLIGEQNYEKVDFMLLKSQWEEFTANVKTLNESHKDIVEEIIDKFEKYTAKDDVHSFEKYKEFIKKVRMISKQKLPSDAQLKGIYNVWVSLRKKIENALLRPFWKKPDINDNSPIASFRSRVPEKMQTRRKNKNDQSNYLKLRMLRKEIFWGRTLVHDVMRREKLKMAAIDLDFMEVKQKYMELQDSSKKNADYEEYIKNEEANFRIDLPSHLAETYRMEDREEEKSEQKSHHDQDMESNRSERSSNKRTKRPHDMDKNSVLEPENSINSDFQSNADVPLSRNPSSAGGPLSQTTTTIPTQPPKDMRAKIDPTTVLQLSIMYHKLSYIGMQVDPNRIKISSTKAIKKEDYLNLSQKELEKELYFRAGTRPKTIKENEDTAGDIKYTIFTARSGRVMILRKPVGGRYEIMDKYKHDELPRSHRETANNLKRIKISENDEVEGIRHSTNPALQYQINNTFGDCYGLEDNTAEDSDESMSDNEKNDKDDYTSGFIERYRKRKGNNKRGNSNVISVRV